VAVTADEHRAVSLSAHQRLQLWDVESGQTLRRLEEGKTSYVVAIALLNDGRRAVSAFNDGTLGLWDLKAAKRSVRSQV
jgi:WD40 repeat protein